MQAGFDKLPTLSGNGSKLVQINSGGTAMAAIALTVGALLFGGAAGVLGQDANLTYTTGTQTLAVPKVSASTSVVTPLLTAAGDVTISTGGTVRTIVLSAANNNLSPAAAMDLGTVALPWGTGRFLTAVVTQLVASASGNLGLGTSGVNVWRIVDLAGTGSLIPVNDNQFGFGDAAHRVLSVFTPIIDSGTTGSLSLKTNNGQIGLTVANNGAATSQLFAIPGTGGIFLQAGGAANTNFDLVTKGTGQFNLRTGSTDDSTGSAVQQFQVLHTASATSNATITGAAAAGTVGATIGVTGGRSLAITPAVVLASSLNFITAAGKIIPGATSISLRNNADNADNLLVTDAGVATVRSSLAWGTGIANFGTITKRKTADESVTSSFTLQDDDHLTFAIAANEEWECDFQLHFSSAVNLNNMGAIVAIAGPSGATLDAVAQITTNDKNTSTLGAAMTFTPGSFNNTDVVMRIKVWMLNGATPGNLTLQWCQSSSFATALKVLKGSVLYATRVA